MKHFALVLLRLAFAYVVLRAMAVAHVWSGSLFPGDGQAAFGFVLVFLLIGAIASLAYFIIASALHYSRRRNSGGTILLTDFVLATVFIGLLALAGATAKYHDSAAPHLP